MKYEMKLYIFIIIIIIIERYKIYLFPLDSKVDKNKIIIIITKTHIRMKYV